jgi:Putative prokaryotic signal transducing protein
VPRFFFAVKSASMKKIYSAANLPDAYMVRDLLRRAGIDARILNEHANAALGEMPMASAYPQVWIEQDHQGTHARQVIDEFEKHTVEGAGRICGKCGESSPGVFEICWNCSAPLGAAV